MPRPKRQILTNSEREALNKLRSDNGTPLLPSPKRQVNLYISGDAVMGLQDLARAHGMVNPNGSASVSNLVEAIGQGNFGIYKISLENP